MRQAGEEMSYENKGNPKVSLLDFLGMILLHPYCRDYECFMIGHDKDLYQHNQDFMEGKQEFFHCSCLAWKWSFLSSKNCGDFWSCLWEDLVLNHPFFFYKFHHDQKIVMFHDEGVLGPQDSRATSLQSGSLPVIRRVPTTPLIL